jgi:diadenylate cyclase
MVRRIASEISSYVVELGTDGRLLSLQLDELVAGTAQELLFVIRDYLPTTGRRQKPLDPVLNALSNLDSASLLDLTSVAGALGLPTDTESLENSVQPRGYRLLSKVPRLPETVIENLISHFGGLQKLLAAGSDELRDVEGVGETRARSIRESLSRLAESSLLERYT